MNRQQGLRVVLITQNDAFYLPRAIEHLIRRFPRHSQIVSCVLLGVSPFGKRESFHSKMLRTWRVFGTAFFLRYSCMYVWGKLRRRDVRRVIGDHGIELIEIEGSVNSEESRQRIAACRPDLLVSIAGNQIFKRALIDLPAQGTLNVHTALLPKYRGLMPTFWVLKNGEAETGVSVFFVDDGIDTGPILVQKRIPIGGKTQAELIRETKTLGMDAVIEAVDLIYRGDYELLPNDTSKASYFSFPERKDVEAFMAAGKRFY